LLFRQEARERNDIRLNLRISGNMIVIAVHSHLVDRVRCQCFHKNAPSAMVSCQSRALLSPKLTKLSCVCERYWRTSKVSESVEGFMTRNGANRRGSVLWLLPLEPIQWDLGKSAGHRQVRNAASGETGAASSTRAPVVILSALNTDLRIRNWK
jgi:hypothetical protein